MITYSVNGVPNALPLREVSEENLMDFVIYFPLKSLQHFFASIAAGIKVNIYREILCNVEFSCAFLKSVIARP
jgi:hypothetical protein